MDDRTGRVAGSTAAAPTQAQVGAAFRASYVQFQYEFVEFFASHLADLSRAFGGDLQLVLVLAVIGQLRLRDLMSDETPSTAGISASRLADVTGIARETVRRKLDSLEKSGWIERVEPASWRIRTDDGAGVVRRALADIDERAIDRIARMFCKLDRIARPPR